MNEFPECPGCEAVQAELNAYLDRELPASKAAAIAGHLEQCVTCRAELELLRLVTRSLRLAARPEPPEAMRHRLLAQVTAERAPHRIDILCVERHGDHVIRRQEVQLTFERAWLPPGRPPAPAIGPVIQQYRRELTHGRNGYRTVVNQYGRNRDERRA